MRHPLTWASPRPMWRGSVRPGRAPTILRFAQDDFAEQLTGIMNTDPARMADHVAKFETWRTPLADTRTDDLTERVPLPPTAKEGRLKTRLGKLIGKKNPAAEPDSQTPADNILKLYQPGHQRHYIATATLACAVPGLPDRQKSGGQEKIGMLLRRLMPATTGDAATDSPLVEYAWIPGGDGAKWQRVADGDANMLAPGEEQLPVFPIAHKDGSINGEGTIIRKMWGSMVPVARREDYLAAPVEREAQSLFEGQKMAMAEPVAAAPKNSTQARTSEFKVDFAEPWKAMIRVIEKEALDINAPAVPSPDDLGEVLTERQVQLRDRNYQMQMQSWYLLLDFSDYLDRHLPNVKAAIMARSSSGLNVNETALYSWLSTQSPIMTASLNRGMSAAGTTQNQTEYKTSFVEALIAINGTGVRDKLESIETDFVPTLSSSETALWPDFFFLLVGIGRNSNGSSIAADGPYRQNTAVLPGADRGDQISQPSSGVQQTIALRAEVIDRLTVLVARALPTSTEQTSRPAPFAERLSKVMVETANDAGLFCIRFVHLNEDCGPIHPPTVSQPTERFQLASFFDPDAPAREIKIMLPKDTSPAGLRKHARGTAFVMSDMLCGQVQRAKGLGLIDLIRQVLPWPLHKDISVGAGGGCKNGNGVDIGMICSLSIPIVTLCALILLMIIVSLLDFIFKWVPWLMICFPVPGLKAKGGGS